MHGSGFEQLPAHMNLPLVVLCQCRSNGADALKKYEGDKDIIEAAMEAGDILQQLQQERVRATQPAHCGHQHRQLLCIVTMFMPSRWQVDGMLFNCQ